MKSLYFQTVGIECKVYENQQLEYRLYSWGQSVFEKSFLQIVTHILQKAFFKHALLCYDVLIGGSRNVFIFQ